MARLRSASWLAAAVMASLAAQAPACKTTGSEPATTVPETSGDERPPPKDGSTAAAPAQGGAEALAVLDALQAKIDADTDTKADRKAAHEQILEWDDGSVAYAFARAALAGRRAQAQGMKAGGLVEESESFARRVLEQNPEFRDGAARRMLGSLYVLAPGRMVKHGDSETGLEMLEEDVEAHPDRSDAHLRVAEAYIALDDPEPGFPHLCFCLNARASMGGEDQRLLDKLVADVGGETVLGCG